MVERDGVEIYSRFYPWPARFRIGDPVLVTELTGLTWPEFAAAVDAHEDAIEAAAASGDDPPVPDQVVLSGLIAVAFWQGNPQMSRDKARKAIERVPLEEITLVGDGAEDDARPPGEAAAAEQPKTSSSGSADSQVAAA